jgi:hypothetical protein
MLYTQVASPYLEQPIQDRIHQRAFAGFDASHLTPTDLNELFQKYTETDPRDSNYLRTLDLWQTHLRKEAQRKAEEAFDEKSGRLLQTYFESLNTPGNLLEHFERFIRTTLKQLTQKGEVSRQDEQSNDLMQQLNHALEVLQEIQQKPPASATQVLVFSAHAVAEK